MGAGLLTDFETARSVACTVIFTESELFARFVSPWSAVVTVAVLVMIWAAVPGSTVALMVRVAEAPLARDTIDH